MNPNGPTPRHNKDSKIKDKERILNAARKKKVNYKGTAIMLSADFSIETPQARTEWQGTVKVLKGKILQPRRLSLARLSFKLGGEIKNFSKKKKKKNPAILNPFSKKY